MQSVHGRKDRKIIMLNEFDQSIGPTDEVVKELGSFLGTLGRNQTFCPLNVFDWRKVDIKNDIWKYVKEKYDIPKEAKNWVFDSVCTAWRKYKSQLKKKHFEAYENDELRMENRPKDVPASHFKDLLEYWNSDAAKKTSETNIENRKKFKHPHTVLLESSRKKRRKWLILQILYQVRTSLWLQEKENLVEYTKALMRIQLVKLLKWREYNQLKKVKMTVIQLTRLHQSWDLNTQVG